MAAETQKNFRKQMDSLKNHPGMRYHEPYHGGIRKEKITKINIKYLLIIIVIIMFFLNPNERDLANLYFNSDYVQEHNRSSIFGLSYENILKEVYSHYHRENYFIISVYRSKSEYNEYLVGLLGLFIDPQQRKILTIKNVAK